MAAPTPIQQKPIHSLILDTGPLIKNAVPIATIINSAEELYTTPAILSEIRDEATRSRVQTTLMPFVKVRNPSPASYDAVIAFSKKTGDHAVLSRQDLGILALAYEVHCERNGGNFGLREVPKGPVKRRPEEEEREKAMKEKNEVKSEKTVTGKETAADEGWLLPSGKRITKGKAAKPTKFKFEAAKEPASTEQTESAEQEVAEEGWAQPTGKRATKARATKPNKFKFEPAEDLAAAEGQAQQPDEQSNTVEASEEERGVAVIQEQVQDQLQDQAEEQVKEQVEEQVQEQLQHRVPAQAQEQVQEQIQEQIQQQVKEQVQEKIREQVPEQIQERTTEEEPIQSTADGLTAPADEGASELPETSTQEVLEPTTIPESVKHGIADLTISPQPTRQLTPPATESSASEDSDDSDGDWITPSNLTAHQAKEAGTQSNTRTAANPQMDVATMTIDFAMQNVLLQMNLHLLSTNMQRIKHVTTKVLRCHACFNIVKQMDKQFCPRCGQPALQRVSCSTNAKGEFKIHLARNYQYNKRGDKYSIPKPIGGTANNKWSGQGGGKGGWGRDLILAEDQKEYQKILLDEQRSKTRDLMDQDYLPGILTGDRGRAGGRVNVGAGKNPIARKKF
ncbi:hypothetical protein EJ02DRAFT_342011 [Clathrospora elynae]|uniref:20S-pre-rRNA D-site endonuclease NOB1 n=1 Tax=Clathrospora elynae TaxID=706981 RepID=A0A6A5SW78_9PLEO|nr:hypothetical protein EJ02DRAFT_342011 [Clathrospora elynae]